MNRKLLVLVAAVLLVMAFAQVSVAAPVKITFWHAMGGELGKTVDQRVSEFNATHQDIVVEAVFRGSYPDVLNGAITAARTSTAPNIVQIYDVGSRAAIDSGVFAPFEDLLKPGEVDWNNYVDAVVNYYRVGGRLYSMPFNSSSAILYYNATLFKKAGLDLNKPPQNFSQVLQASRALKKRGLQGGITWPLHTWFVEQWMAEQGAPLVNNDNGRSARPTAINTDTKAMRTIFNWWKQLYSEGLWINPGVENWDQADALFVSKQVGMLITSTSDVTMLTNAGKENGFEVQTAYLPIPDSAERYGVVPGGASLWVVANKPRAELEAARTFLLWLVQPEQQIAWHKATGYFPVNKLAIDQLQAQGWFKTNPNYRIALDQVLGTRRSVATQGALIGRFQQVRTTLEEAFQKVMGGTPVDTALSEAKTKIEADFADYNSLF